MAAEEYVQPVAVDFAAVKANAAKQGIVLQEIAIMYEGLTEDEVRTLTELGLVGLALGKAGSLLGKFPDDGEAMFQDKAVSVQYLGD